MKLEIGLYFRTKGGAIGKIDSMTEDGEDGTEIYFDTKPIFSDEEEIDGKWCYAEDIIKTSHNIIDLIEVGDYVNGHQVYEVDKDCCRITLNGGDIGEEFRFTYLRPALGKNMGIKTIMTKDFFENNCYKVGD